MSAFMCSDRHLTVLAKAAVAWNCYRSPKRTEDPRELEREAFEMLANENIRSLEARYPNHNPEEVGCLLGDTHLEMFTPVTVIKLCHCYAYQACEHRGWEESETRKLIKAIEGSAVRKLPGYEQAPWGI